MGTNISPARDLKVCLTKGCYSSFPNHDKLLPDVSICLLIKTHPVLLAYLQLLV